MSIRPKQDDLGGIEGPGVSKPKFRDIDKLADRYIEHLDEMTGLKTTLEELELSILGKMEEHGLSIYTFSDRQITIKAGKTRINIKPYKSEGVATEPEE